MSGRTYGIELTADGDLPPVAQRVRLDTIGQIKQRIEVRLLTHRGEWLPDRREGLPYYRWSQTKPAPVDLMVQAMTATILDVPGVTSATLSGRFDASSQLVSISGSIIAEEEQITISYTTEPTLTDPPRLEWIGGTFSGVF